MIVLDMVTRTGHDVVMKQVRIARLKARLSGFLRAVRRGETLTIYDRDTPVARIVPYAAGSHRLVVRHPPPGAPKLHAIPMPPPLDLGFDVVDFLLEDREKR